MVQTLLKENSYNGRFVAFKDFDDHTVIGEGNTPQQALKKAVERGFVNPVVTFIPLKGMVQIY